MRTLEELSLTSPSNTHALVRVMSAQMLESMQKNPRPTRAEVADVTNAVLEMADAVMLSGESANGQYPDTAVGMQANIAKWAEKWQREQDEYPSYSVEPVRRAFRPMPAAPTAQR